MRLKDQVALVTDGGAGIGRAAALALAREGAAVAVNSVLAVAEAEAVAAQIRECGGRALAVEADVSEDPRVRDMVGRVLGEWGRVDVLVNSAAVAPPIDFADLQGLTEELWDHTFAVNLKGLFFCCRAVAPIMKRQKMGRIINLASTAGITGRGASPAYCASKAGVISLTQSLAVAFAPEIRVNAVAPGLPEAVATAVSAEGRPFETPLLGRAPTAEEIAEVILSFATDASFVTGQVLKVDGGT